MKIKILFFIQTLNIGGSERVFSTIINEINKEKFDVTLVLLKKEGAFLKQISSDIKIIDLNEKHVRNSFVKTLCLIKKLNPHIVFSTVAHLNVFLSLVKPFLSQKIKFIARESTIPSINNKRQPFPRFFHFLYIYFLRTMDHIICQSKYMQNDIFDKFGVDLNKISVIHNPVYIDINYIESLKKCSLKSISKEKKKRIVACGRLSIEKGFDLLIQAFALTKVKPLSLTIIGDGSERKKLENLSEQLGVKKNIIFMGFVDDPAPILKKADLFILSSHYEGFPNSVLESLAYGVPVLSVKCPGGIEDIIINNFNGWILNDRETETLAVAIDKRVTHKLNSDKIAEQILNNFNISKITGMYEKIFEKIAEI